MRRREFVTLLSGAAFAAPAPSRAQGAGKIARVGILTVGGLTSAMTGPAPRYVYVDALLAGLRERGRIYGRDFTTEPRGGEGRPERYPGLVAEVLAARSDVVVASGAFLPWLKRATATVPVVMSASDDPIGEGLVASFARPGGNFTGLSHQSVDLVAKRLELLRELVPGAGALAVLWDRVSAGSWIAAEAAASARGWKLLSLELRDAAEIDAAFGSAAAARAEGILVFASSQLFARRQSVVALAARHRLPAMYAFKPFVEEGGLISYAPDVADTWRRAAGFVDKILKGVKPADLPVEQPTKFELAINLKTAKALGLAVPPTLLTFATDVIE